MLTEKDKIQLRELGIPESALLEQVNNFRNGFPFTELVKPAVIGDGLLPLDEKKASELAAFYENKAGTLNLLKFTPASGAATRMFKDLYAFLADITGDVPADSLLGKHPEAATFFDRLKDFAFYDDLKESLHDDPVSLVKKGAYETILKQLLGQEGLAYGSLPKGLLAFHRYQDHYRTSIEEHLVEGALYARSHSGNVRVHFTLSPGHREKFEKLMQSKKQLYENKFGIRLEVAYSFQKSSTDMVAVDMNNEFLREEDGSLVFRPGGHGALLDNLDELEADLIFIKNIDNIVPDRYKDTTVLYKKALAGMLLQLKEKIDRYIGELETNPGSDKLQEIYAFTRDELYVVAPSGTPVTPGYLLSILNRPIRVCGMVKNEGEPGGGPFWVKGKRGNLSLQVVESSQVDLQNPSQKSIFGSATHFNPVDLVCCTRDYRGKKFHLPDFRDPQTGFIAQKSKDGKKLKAQELPGLWNGAMAYWNTVFVEVPLLTFNPVKSVNDLLRENHQ